MCLEQKINKIIDILGGEGKNLHFNSKARRFIERKNEKQKLGEKFQCHVRENS